MYARTHTHTPPPYSVCPLCNDKVTEAVTTVCCRQIIYCHGCLTEHLKEFNQRPNCKHTFGSAEKTQPQSSNSMNYTVRMPLTEYASHLSDSFSHTAMATIHPMTTPPYTPLPIHMFKLIKMYLF